MSIHRKLTTVCCAAVLALGLAACGSSDDDKTPPMDGDGMEPTALEIATELAGRLESVDVAESLANAIKYSEMLSSGDVNGDSAMATANAEMVLTAETAINDAVTAADTAIMEANAAKMAAEDIENEAEKDAVMRLLDDAIKTAMEVKKKAQDDHRRHIRPGSGRPWPKSKVLIRTCRIPLPRQARPLHPRSRRRWE